jgi:hypothetical protein
VIGAPTRPVEWKIDSPYGFPILKKIEDGKITLMGKVEPANRECYRFRISGMHGRMTYADTLAEATEILWSWRNPHHHPLCECQRCAIVRPWDYDEEGGAAMTDNNRVLYCPPAGQPQRRGALLRTSGVSAQVQFDDCPWPRWAPLSRLVFLLDDVGWIVTTEEEGGESEHTKANLGRAD